MPKKTTDEAKNYEDNLAATIADLSAKLSYYTDRNYIKYLTPYDADYLPPKQIEALRNCLEHLKAIQYSNLLQVTLEDLKAIQSGDYSNFLKEEAARKEDENKMSDFNVGHIERPIGSSDEEWHKICESYMTVPQLKIPLERPWNVRSDKDWERWKEAANSFYNRNKWEEAGPLDVNEKTWEILCLEKRLWEKMRALDMWSPDELLLASQSSRSILDKALESGLINEAEHEECVRVLRLSEEEEEKVVREKAQEEAVNKDNAVLEISSEALQAFKEAAAREELEACARKKWMESEQRQDAIGGWVPGGYSLSSSEHQAFLEKCAIRREYEEQKARIEKNRSESVQINKLTSLFEKVESGEYELPVWVRSGIYASILVIFVGLVCTLIQYIWPFLLAINVAFFLLVVLYAAWVCKKAFKAGKGLLAALWDSQLGKLFR